MNMHIVQTSLGVSLRASSPLHLGSVGGQCSECTSFAITQTCFRTSRLCHRRRNARLYCFLECRLLSLLRCKMTLALVISSRFSTTLTFQAAHILAFLYYFDIPGSVVAAPYVQMIAFAEDTDYCTWAESSIAKFEGENHRINSLCSFPLPIFFVSLPLSQRAASRAAVSGCCLCCRCFCAR